MFVRARGASRSASRDLASETRVQLVGLRGLGAFWRWGDLTLQSASVSPTPSQVMVGSWHLQAKGQKMGKLVAFVPLHTSMGLSWRTGATGSQNPALLLGGPVKISAQFGLGRITWWRFLANCSPW